MTADDASGGSYLGIIELGAICAEMRARNLVLFEQLGAWVVDTADPVLQRLFGEASHLHAWHAELWAQRAPLIPPVELDNSVAAPGGPSVALDRRAAIYGDALDRLLGDLRALRSRIDVLLDPSTVRTIELVMADDTGIRRRLDV